MKYGGVSQSDMSQSHPGADPDGDQRKTLIDRIVRDPQREVDELIDRIRQQRSGTVPGASFRGLPNQETGSRRKEDTVHIDFYCGDMHGSPHQPEQALDQRISLAIRQVMDRDGRVLLSSRGQSMFPYIQEGDNCTFLARDAGLLKRGDVVLYQAPSGMLIAHRFLRLQRDVFGLTTYIIKGDSNLNPDPPVYAEQMIGILTKIEPVRRKIRLSHIFRSTWRSLVLNFSLMSRSLNRYLTMRNRAAGVFRKK